MRRFTRGSQQSPAVGTDLSAIIENRDSFLLNTVRITFTTSAVVANRFPHFQITDKDGTVLHEIVAVAAQAAASTVLYQLTRGNGAPYQGGAVSDGVSGIALPDITFPEGCLFKTKTTAIDVGDQYSAFSWSALIGDEFEHVKWLEEIAGSIGD
jgi:hypothetical protein